MTFKSLRSQMLTVGVAICVLSGCKEDVYTGLSEREANEMVAVLAASSLTPSRSRDKDGIYAVRVEAQNVPTAITILRNAGYPQTNFETMGKVFQGDGVFSTPFEQHARYIHALNQELSATLTAVEGIRLANVLVTSPAKDRLGTEQPAATAAVVIHHEPEFKVQQKLSSIKLIVAHAVPNMAYDDVSVAIFAAGGPILAELPAQVSEPILTQTSSMGPLLLSYPQQWIAEPRFRDPAILFAIAAVFCSVAARTLCKRDRRNHDV